MAALLRRSASILSGLSGMGRLFTSILTPILDPLACLPPPPESRRTSSEASSPDISTAVALLRHLDLRLRRRFAGMEPGRRRSLLRGQGLDFAELREYHPGDDIRKIDWNVLARTLTPHVREYHDEKRQTLWLAADVTASMRFGRQRRKIDQVIALAGYIGLLVCQGGHRLGAVLITDNGPEILPPSVGEAAVQRMLSRLLAGTYAKSDNGKEDILKDPLTEGCQQLARIVTKQSTVFFLSDFLLRDVSESPGLSQIPSPESAPDDGERLFAWQRALGRLSRRVRLIYLPVFDPVEMHLPPRLGRLPVIDPETGDLAEVDTDDVRFRAAYTAETQARQTRLLAWLRQTGQVVPASTEIEALDILLALLKGGNSSMPETATPGRAGP
jgi:uncharacterized protein (DUF58 family)